MAVDEGSLQIINRRQNELVIRLLKHFLSRTSNTTRNYDVTFDALTFLDITSEDLSNTSNLIPLFITYLRDEVVRDPRGHQLSFPTVRLYLQIVKNMLLNRLNNDGVQDIPYHLSNEVWRQHIFYLRQHYSKCR